MGFWLLVPGVLMGGGPTSEPVVVTRSPLYRPEFRPLPSSPRPSMAPPPSTYWPSNPQPVSE